MAAGVRGYVVVPSGAHAGKTVLAGALAQRFRRASGRVGVFVPVAFGCSYRIREGLVSEDAEFLAHCGDCQANMPTICPVRFGQLCLPGDYSTVRVPPADMKLIMECWTRLSGEHDLMIVQAPAGIYHPLGNKLQVIDLLVKLGLGIIVVGLAQCQAISNLLMTIKSLRAQGLAVEAVALNRYQALEASAAEEISPEVIARLADVPLPVMIPPDSGVNISAGTLGRDITFAVEQIRL